MFRDRKGIVFVLPGCVDGSKYGLMELLVWVVHYQLQDGWKHRAVWPAQWQLCRPVPGTRSADFLQSYQYSGCVDSSEYRLMELLLRVLHYQLQFVQLAVA
jgi:hypothetical protein